MSDELPATHESVDRNRWLRGRAVATYAVFAALWILGSDKVLDYLVQDRATIIQVGVYKGWLFVAITSALLYWLLRPVQPESPPPAAALGTLRSWVLPFGLIVVLVVVLVAAAVRLSYIQVRDEHAEQLEAVAELRAEQVGQWLEERISQAQFAADAPSGELHLRWREVGDASARDRLAKRLSNLWKASRSREVFVADDQGRMFGPSGDIHRALPGELEPLVKAAIQGNQVRFGDPRDAGNDVSRFDIAVPMLVGSGPPGAALVVRLDPNEFLLSLLNRWPLPGHSGGTMLVGRDGRELLSAPSYKARPRPQLSKLDVTGRAVDRLNASGEKFLVVALPVAGTDWLLVDSIPFAEIAAGARDDVFWISAVGVLTVLACAIGLFLVRQSVVLQLKEAEGQQQAEKLQALQLLQSIADSSTDMIYAKDKAGRIVLFNREACRVTGIPPLSAIGKTVHDIYPAAQAEQMRIADQKVLETGQSYSFENEIATVDGPRTFLSTKGLLRGPDGEATGVFGISRDITERMSSEKALRESAELIRAVGNSILDHLAVLDAAGNVIQTNHPWRAFGAGPNALACAALPRCEIGANYLAEMSRSDSPHVEPAREGIEAVLAGRQPVFTFDYDCECAGSAKCSFVMKVTPLKTARGGAVLVYSDVTELKRATAELGKYRDHLEELVEERTDQLARMNLALQGSERFVRTLTDNIPAGLAYWGADRRCRFANRQYRERFGLSAEDIEVATLHDVLEPELYERLKPAFERVLAGRRFEYASVVKSSDGTDEHFLVTLLPDTVDGTTEGVFVLATEVTALKHAELQLQRANAELVVARDRAEAANRAKSAFMANMSHEIRTPMNAIIGFTELLKDDSGKPVESELLDHIGEAAQHLLAVINDILDLSKIESGKFTLEHTGFSLRDAVTRAVTLVGNDAKAKGLALSVDISGVPDALCGDPTRLSQALLNLLGNAVKFTERGRIDMRASVVEETAADVLVRFEVQDTGIGIAADKLGSLFNAFEQADSSTTRRFGGTGLGLALTRHLAHLMGGAADATSELGRGSTFWFTARLARFAISAEPPPTPALRPPTAETSAARPQDAEVMLVRPPAHGRVLVVEDNRFNQEVAMAVLQRAGLSVELAVDGRQAVAMAQARSYDLVLMDLQMPVMDGFEATRALRLLPAYRETPILALTANAFGETRAACLAAGMDDHIAKPVTLQRLHEHLARWLPPAALPRPATTAQPAAAGLLEALAGIEGFEPAVGLALTENQGAFVELLQQFIAGHEDGVPGLDSALAKGARAQARLMVHTLKGASAAIGARLLQQLASSCELAIAGGEPIEKLRLLAFDIEYELVHLVGALHDRLPPAVSGEDRRATGMDAGQIDAAVQTLGNLLASGDYGAQRFHREIAADLRDAFGDAAGTLAAAVRDHDHERALELIETMKAGPRAATVAKDL